MQEAEEDFGRAQILEELARQVIELARERELRLATAESLTGGMVGNYLCTVPGASAVYQGGVISYSNAVKEQVLGVDGALLAHQGSVDPMVAEQMASGVARVCGAELAISTTGVAGPDSHDGKPVGRVYLGLTDFSGSKNIEKNYEGTRSYIRFQSTREALNILVESLVKI